MAIKEHSYTADLGGATQTATTVSGQPLNEISVPSATGGEPAVWKLVDVTDWPTARYEIDTLPATVSADLAHAGIVKPKGHVVLPQENPGTEEAATTGDPEGSGGAEN